jgi:hypothetical protein
MVGFGLNRANWFAFLDKSHAKAKISPPPCPMKDCRFSSRGDKTAIELSIAGVRGLEARVRQFISTLDERKGQADGVPVDFAPYTYARISLRLSPSTCERLPWQDSHSDHVL